MKKFRSVMFVLMSFLLVVSFIGCSEDDPDTFNVSYLDNGSTSGTVPVDDTAYTSGLTVTVSGNTGGLIRTEHLFLGWTNTAGVSFTNGQTFMISNNVALYAHWDSIPSANAGTNFAATLGTLVTLNGSGSTDVENPTLTYLWEVDAGNPAAVTLSDTGVANPTFTAPTTLGDYTFKLTVGDGITNSSAQVTVTVGLASAIYVDASAGDDANLGTVKSAPKKTIKSGFTWLAQNGTIYVSGDQTFTSDDPSYTSSSTGLYITQKSDFTLSGGWDSGFTTQGSASVLHGNNARAHVVMFNQCNNFSMENFILRNGFCSSGTMHTSGTGLYVLECADVSLNIESCYNTNTINIGGGVYFSNTDRITLRGSVHHNHMQYAAVYASTPDGFTNYANIHNNHGWYTPSGGWANAAALTVQAPHGAVYISGAIYNNFANGSCTAGVCTGNNTTIASDAVITNNTAPLCWSIDKGIGVYNTEVDNGTSVIQAGAIYSPNITTNQSYGGWFTLIGANNVLRFTIE